MVRVYSLSLGRCAAEPAAAFAAVVVDDVDEEDDGSRYQSIDPADEARAAAEVAEAGLPTATAERASL